MVTVPTGEFQVFLCDSGNFIPLNTICNGVRDCYDGKDETHILCDSKLCTVNRYYIETGCL